MQAERANAEAGIQPFIQADATIDTKPVATPVIQPQIIAEPVPPVVSQTQVPAAAIPELIPAPNQTSTPTPVNVTIPVISETPVAELIPQPEAVKVTEPEVVELPQHDVPVQSHHRSSFSIKSVMQADQLAGSVKADLIKDRTGTFTFEQLEELLLRFAELKKFDSALFYAALTSYKAVLQPDNVLLLTVGNTVLAKELNERRNILLEFLREELKNDFITMQIKVTEQQTETKKYMNDRDKLDAMAAQNPNVNKLRDQLNLDLDL
jgi:hypothetical protein